jgi:hypothetical protein
MRIRRSLFEDLRLFLTGVALTSLDAPSVLAKTRPDYHQELDQSGTDGVTIPFVSPGRDCLAVAAPGQFFCPEMPLPTRRHASLGL